MIRKTFAAVLALIFIFLTSSILIIWNFYSTVTDRDVYNEDFSAQLYSYSIEKFSRDVNLDDFKVIDEVDFKEILMNVVSEKDFEHLVLDIYDQINLLEVNKQNQIEIMIPLNFLEGKSEELSEEVYGYVKTNLPECESTVSLSNFDFECIPENVDPEDLKNEIQSLIDINILTEIPDDYVFTLDIPGKVSGKFVDLLTGSLKLAFILSIVLAVILFLFIGLLVLKPFNSILKWLSATLFLTALVSTFFFAVIRIITSLGNIFADLIGNNMDPLTFNLCRNLCIYFFTIVSNKGLIISIPIAVISLILFIIAFIRYRKHDEFDLP